MKKNVLVGLLTLTAGIAATTIATTVNHISADEVVSFQSSYEYNSTLEIPTYKVGNTVFDAVLVYPSGDAYHVDTAVLNQSGKYTVIYSGMVNGKAESHEYSFVVNHQFYSFSGTQSYFQYKTSLDHTNNVPGLEVNLARGEVFNCNKVIDLTDTSKTDWVVQVFVDPYELKTEDITNLFIQFTDVMDSNSYIKFKAIDHYMGVTAPWSYLTAAGTDQGWAGWDHQYSKIHYNNEYGTPVQHSFWGNYPNSSVGPIGANRACLNLAFDASDLSLYCNEYLITKFDNTDYYPVIWSGFKSGKVRMSIWSEGYLNDFARLGIKGIRGCDLTASVITDNEAPEITITTGYDSLPAAIVGKKYPTFSATAYDTVSEACEVKTRVYYKVNTTKEINVNIDENGYFDVKRSGTYRIEYTAVDGVGNIAKKELIVNTSDSLDPITITPTGSIQGTVPQGEPYTFPTFNTTGGSGKYTSRFEVYKDNQLYDKGNDSFIPKEKGTYKVKYIVSDITTQEKTYEYDLTSVQNNNVVVYEEPKLPKYVFSDYQFFVPSCTGVDYSGETPKEVSAEVEIDYGFKKVVAPSGSNTYFEAEKNFQTVNLTYKFKGTTLAYDIPCVKTHEDGILQFKNYFDTYNLKLDLTNYKNKAKLTKTSPNAAGFKYTNATVAEGFEMTLTTDEVSSMFETLTFKLEDKYNPNEVVTFTLEKDSRNKVSTHISGAVTKTGYAFKSNTTFAIGYSNGNVVLGGLNYPIATYDNGKPFAGFSSDYIYYSMEMTDGPKNSCIFLNKIDNQLMGSFQTDLVSPRVSLIGSYGGYQQLNSIGKVVRVLASDAFDPTITPHVTVTTPSKVVAKSIDDEVLKNVCTDQEYSIKLTEFGQYLVKYVCEDAEGNENAFSYAIGISKAPVITIKVEGKVQTSAKVGEYIIVPNYTYSADVENAELSTYVSIVSPTGQIYYLPEGSNALKASNKGDYLVNINVIDKNGTLEVYSYKVTVK